MIHVRSARNPVALSRTLSRPGAVSGEVGPELRLRVMPVRQGMAIEAVAERCLEWGLVRVLPVLERTLARAETAQCLLKEGGGCGETNG